ncbi:MAG TPA: SRPBCC domain-containing protein [Gaiellaceae bacterium]|nr:SRPBCC domain-containing protein [Gaiellaceae bacterium]
MAVRQDEAVEREVRIAARPETVFDFLVDPEKQILWMGRRAELDPRPGGTYLVEINDQATARGEYVEVVPPSRVLFTFGWEGQQAGEGEHGVPPGSSRVEVTLEPDGDGTLVRLRHFGLPEQAREMHGQGWELYLGRLAVAATGADPGPDPNLTTE